MKLVFKTSRGGYGWTGCVKIVSGRDEISPVAAELIEELWISHDSDHNGEVWETGDNPGRVHGTLRFRTKQEAMACPAGREVYYHDGWYCIATDLREILSL